jgi:hypothetical protein
MKGSQKPYEAAVLKGPQRFLDNGRGQRNKTAKEFRSLRRAHPPDRG